MTLTQMRSILRERDLWLTKSLGQNFLHDQNQIDRILDLAEIHPSDRILEIGPGLGALTARFASIPDLQALIIEKDQRLLDWLTEGNLGRREGFQWLGADALKWLKRHPRDWRGWKLVSNLPYSVGSPILVELGTNPEGPDRLVVTLQLEVIQRLRARPGSADYGLLTVLLGLFYQTADWFRVPRGCFFPEPDVDSACLALVRRDEPPMSATETPTYLRLVKRAFGQRRKTLAKSLSGEWSSAAIAEALPSVGIDLKARPEELGVPEFVALAKALAGGTPTG